MDPASNAQPQVVIRLTPRAPRVTDLTEDVLVDLSWQPQAGGLSRHLTRRDGERVRARRVEVEDYEARSGHTGPVVIAHVRSGLLTVVWASPEVRVLVERRGERQAVGPGESVSLRAPRRTSARRSPAPRPAT